MKARGGCSPLLRLTDSKACVRVCVQCTCGQAPVPRKGASICIPFPGLSAIRRLQTTEERRARPGRQEPLRAAGPSCAPVARGPAACYSLTAPLFCLFQLTERTFDRRHRLGPHKDAEGEVQASARGLPSGSQPPRRTAVCTLSRPHCWPPTPLPLPSAPAGPPGAAGQGWVRLVPLPSATGAAVVYRSCSSCCSPGLHNGLP